MNKKTTISEVAKLAKVSKSTISNYLNGRYESMSIETRERIETAIQELRYTPSLSARRLSAKEKSKTICLIIPKNLASIYFSKYYSVVFNVIGKEAEKAGYNVLIYARTSKDIDTEVSYLKSLAMSLVDGFIIYDLKQENMYFREFDKLNIPYVCVGKIYGQDDYPYVASDHYQAMEDSMEYLLNLGHKKISLIADDAKGVVEVSRLHAYEKVMKKWDLEVDKRYFLHVSTKTSKEALFEQCIKILSLPDAPSAYMVVSTHMECFLQAVKRKGLSIPQDISVITLEYYESDSFTRYDFTHVESLADTVSRVAFQKLMYSIYQPDEKFESELERLTLVIGNTTIKV